MFVDVAKVRIKAGDGGDGSVSFRHEKFVDRGGPDGGDGGHGGDVIFRASNNANTLANFRFQKEIKAEDGQAGSKRKKHGKSGADLVVNVPVGTTIISQDDEIIADLTEDGQKATVARGGKGGYGNAHFISSTRQAPKVAEKGEPGEELEARLELKTIAEVGLVGLPNAGKSTLLSVVSNAKPQIANYPFTTLTPNLGVVDIDNEASLLMADIPGLIEGASQGKGLGDDFLRHIERTKVLLHLIDIYNDDIKGSYQTIMSELKNYKIDLSSRPQIVVLTKIDGLDEEIVEDRTRELKKLVPKNTKIYAISAIAKDGIMPMLRDLNKLVKQQRSKALKNDAQDDKLPVITLKADETQWTIKQIKNGFEIKGKKIEKFAIRTDFDNYHAVRRLKDIMKKMGILQELRRRGAEPGTIIKIGQNEIEI